MPHPFNIDLMGCYLLLYHEKLQRPLPQPHPHTPQSCPDIGKIWKCLMNFHIIYLFSYYSEEPRLCCCKNIMIQCFPFGPSVSLKRPAVRVFSTIVVVVDRDGIEVILCAWERHLETK